MNKFRSFFAGKNNSGFTFIELLTAIYLFAVASIALIHWQLKLLNASEEEYYQTVALLEVENAQTLLYVGAFSNISALVAYWQTQVTKNLPHGLGKLDFVNNENAINVSIEWKMKQSEKRKVDYTFTQFRHDVS